MSADQMIKFAKAVDLEASLATFGILEDVLMKIGGKAGRVVVIESVGGLLSLAGLDQQLLRVSLLVHFSLCLLSQNQWVVIPQQTDFPVEQPCSSRQADAAMGISQTQVTAIIESDSLKTLE